MELKDAVLKIIQELAAESAPELAEEVAEKIAGEFITDEVVEALAADIAGPKAPVSADEESEEGDSVDFISVRKRVPQTLMFVLDALEREARKDTVSRARIKALSTAVANLTLLWRKK